MVVNTVLGDESFLLSYHINPHLLQPFFFLSSPSFEIWRIHTHLLHVYNILIHGDCSELDQRAKEKRKEGLRSLKEYAERREYPRNYDSNEREPSFVDKDGRMCAVAYIMHDSGETALVKEIDALFHNCKLYDMHHSKLANWIAQSGFTLKELASIQPGYPPFHYCFSTFFYAFMCLFLGISSVYQYEHAMSPAPPHYKQILLGLVVNNFVGLVFSTCVCLIATMTRKARHQIIPIALRWLWAIANVVLLSYYQGHLRTTYSLPNKTNNLLLGGLVLTCVCILISVLCDSCGVLMQGSLNHKFKWGKNRRGPDGELKSEYTKDGTKDNDGKDVELGNVSVSVTQDESVDAPVERKGSQPTEDEKSGAQETAESV